MSDKVTVHIHEDDEGMRNIYPAAAVFEAAQDIEAAKASAEKNKAPGGVGWTAIHEIQVPKAGFAETPLTHADASKALGAHLPRIDHFEVGYGSGNPFHYADAAPEAFGYGNHLYVKLEGKEGALSGIWYDVGEATPNELAALRAALLALNALTPIMIADYWGDISGRVSDAGFMNSYFAWLAETD